MSTQSFHHIAELQIGVDNHFNKTLLSETLKLSQIQENVGTLNESLGELRRKLKRNTHSANLQESYHILEKARGVWDALKEEYKNLPEADEIFLTTHKNLKEVPMELVERLLDSIENIKSQEQGKIPLISQSLKLATDLNEILSKIIAELAKEDKRSRQTPVNNMRA
jgi:hypothetical protein